MNNINICLHQTNIETTNIPENIVFAIHVLLKNEPKKKTKNQLYYYAHQPGEYMSTRVRKDIYGEKHVLDEWFHIVHDPYSARQPVYSVTDLNKNGIYFYMLNHYTYLADENILQIPIGAMIQCWIPPITYALDVYIGHQLALSILPGYIYVLN